MGNVYLRYVDSIPDGHKLRKKAKWEKVIEEFMASGAQIVVVDEEGNAGTAAENRRIYNGLTMAIRRKYADKHISAILRKGTVYLAKNAEAVK